MCVCVCWEGGARADDEGIQLALPSVVGVVVVCTYSYTRPEGNWQVYSSSFIRRLSRICYIQPVSAWSRVVTLLSLSLSLSTYLQLRSPINKILAKKRRRCLGGVGENNNKLKKKKNEKKKRNVSWQIYFEVYVQLTRLSWNVLVYFTPSHPDPQQQYPSPPHAQKRKPLGHEPLSRVIYARSSGGDGAVVCFVCVTCCQQDETNRTARGCPSLVFICGFFFSFLHSFPSRLFFSDRTNFGCCFFVVDSRRVISCWKWNQPGSPAASLSYVAQHFPRFFSPPQPASITLDINRPVLQLLLAAPWWLAPTKF